MPLIRREFIRDWFMRSFPCVSSVFAGLKYINALDAIFAGSRHAVYSIGLEEFTVSPKSPINSSRLNRFKLAAEGQELI